MKNDLLKERLRSSFFTRMNNLSMDSYVEEMTTITEDVHYLIQSKYTSLYEKIIGRMSLS